MSSSVISGGKPGKVTASAQQQQRRHVLITLSLITNHPLTFSGYGHLNINQGESHCSSYCQGSVTNCYGHKAREFRVR